jgi:acetyl esterase/lipase
MPASRFVAYTRDVAPVSPVDYLSPPRPPEWLPKRQKGIGLVRLPRIRRVMISLAAVMATGCSPTQLVNALVPHGGFKLTADRPYGPVARQKLDIYTPTTMQRPKPAVVFIYGGNWQRGAKTDYLFLGQAFASRGFITVVPDYRLYPEVSYPAFIEDGAKAVRWTLAHIEEFGGDAAQINVMGHSAGAYIASMLALDQRWLGNDRMRLHSLIGLAGPYDFLPLTDPVLQVIFGTEPDLSRTQPITFVDGSAPPSLLISGLNDTTVRPANSKHLAARIRAHGGIAEEAYYRGVGHVSLIGAIARPLHFMAPTLNDVIEFLNRE